VHVICPGHVPSQPAAEPQALVPAQITPHHCVALPPLPNVTSHMQLATPGPV
jgi:hypothetical protein